MRHYLRAMAGTALSAMGHLALVVLALAAAAALCVVFGALMFFFAGLFLRLVEPVLPAIRCWLGTGPCG